MKVIISNIKLKFNHSMEDMRSEVARKLRIRNQAIQGMKIDKRSVDARRKPQVFFVYSLIVNIKGNISDTILSKANARRYVEKSYVFPYEPVKLGKRPVIIGLGPAGMFCGLLLARNGYKPVIVERGEEATKRYETIRRFIETGDLDLNSNITFGEGGAGTFSDGKLNTGVKDKFLRKQWILKALVKHGADPTILYMAKPHVGTDYLVKVVEGIRNEIIELGGTVHFNTRASGLLLEEGEKRMKGVRCECKGESFDIESDKVILAIGHSARDTFELLHTTGVPMEAKSFAIGLRIEHPQSWINRSQYGGKHYDDPLLPSAEYKLTHQTGNGRGVYSFCMCPGGYVVNASSHENMVVCNGMSLFARDNFNANSALIVTVSPDDFEQTDHPLRGVWFQEKWEKKAYQISGSYALPTQSYGDFHRSVTGREVRNNWKDDAFYAVRNPDKVIDSTCESAMTSSDLTCCLPSYVAESIVEGIENFGKKIRGFNHPAARLTGVETRTSSPVKIFRGDNFMSDIRGLYPCGEGAGYAGGIMSASIDGMKVAEMIVKNAGV